VAVRPQPQEQEQQLRFPFAQLLVVLLLLQVVWKHRSPSLYSGYGAF
jgi:hypothetical protein